LAHEPLPNGIAWAMELTGHEFDLNDLMHWTSGNSIQILKFGDRYDLVMPFDIVGRDHKPVRARAESYLGVLNGIGAISCDSFCRVDLLSALHTIDENGKRRDTFMLLNGTRMRIRGGRVGAFVNGAKAGDPTQGLASPYMAIADELKAAEDALVLVGRPRPSWSELYVVYELVLAGSKGDIVRNGWASDAELGRFKGTANSYTALGTDGRHGDPSRPAPRRTMGHGDAVKLIRRMVATWLKSLAAQHAAAPNADPSSGG
jgi:hypothetical protein